MGSTKRKQYLIGTVVAGLSCGANILFSVADTGWMTLVSALVIISWVVALTLEYTDKMNRKSLEMQYGWKLRDNCENGFFCVILVPTAIILTAILGDVHLIDPYTKIVLILSAFTMLMSIGVCICVVIGLDPNNKYTCHDNLKDGAGDLRHPDLISSTTTLSLIAAPLYGGLMFLLLVSVLLSIDLRLYALMAVSLCTLAYLQAELPKWLPYSFSIGEAAIVCQAAMYFLFSITCQMLHKSSIMQIKSGHLEKVEEVTLYMEIAVLSAAIVMLLLHHVPSLRKSVSFYLITLAVAGGFSLPVLYLTFKQNFVSWTINYVRKTNHRVNLFMYWAGSCVVAVLTVYINTQKLKSLEETKKESKPESDDNQKGDELPSNRPKRRGAGQVIDKISQKRKDITNVVRKVFHILAIAVFLPGFVLDPEVTCNAATCAVVVFVMLEGMRVLKIWPFGESLEKYFQVFIDERDGGIVILTHIYLLVGCVLPLWLYPVYPQKDIPQIILSGVLSLGVGDTAASVFGTLFGRKKWPGTKKTQEGTLAAIGCQVIVVFILYITGILVDVYSMKVLGAIVLSSLLEAFTTQIDNLVLPLFMYILLIEI